MTRLGFLASHNGSSMRAIVAAARGGALDAEPAVVISNNGAAPALAFARAEAIPTHHLSAATCGSAEAADRAIADVLHAAGVDLVVLSGYMRKLGPAVLAAFPDRILNVHPALLPKHGGRGLYGVHVHAAVLAAGEVESGATIHLVDAIYDHGRVLAQARVSVLAGDTAETLGARIAAVEPPLYIETLRRIISGALPLQ